MVKKLDEVAPVVPEPAPEAAYDAAIAAVAKAVKTLCEAGMGGHDAGELACAIWCKCCGHDHASKK